MGYRKAIRIFLFVIAFLLHGCGGSSLAPVLNRSAAAPGAPSYYHVHTGDTLYSISWAYGYDYHDVARWNGIRWPYEIHPGQTIRLSPPPQHYRSRGSRERAKRSSHRRPPASPARHASTSRPVHGWVWPVRGPLLSSFAPGNPARKGIDIGGDAGEPIRAAAAGEVVYSGDGLIHYGKLLIIKHNSVYFSAYAHNRKLLVKEGERVRAGQIIAQMGSTGSTRIMLHFEIRRDGKPVNPLRYLPKR